VARLAWGVLEYRAERRFVERQRRRTPGESFTLPGFFWTAFIPAAVVFLAMALSLIYLLFILPRHNEVVARALSSLIPNSD